MQTLTLNRQALLALIVATAFPLSALAGVGSVEFATGTVNAQSADGATRTLTKGAEVNIGDTLKTLSGRMQVKFSDGGYISLQPNTEFTIDEYNYTGNNKGGKEKGFFKLVKGGLRAITGAIGKTDKESYKVSTPTATIGIRGTEYVALQEGDRLQVKVGAGAVVIQNDAGNLVLYQGQSGEVSGPSAPPQQSTETPSVTAAAPAGNSVTETTEESSTDSVYVDGNVRLDSDSLCQTGAGECTDAEIDEVINSPQLVPSLALANQLISGGLAHIPLLNQISAAANYVSSTFSFSFAGGTANANAFLDVFFHNYSARTAINGAFVGGNYDTQFFFAEAMGTLNPNTGALTFTNGTGEIFSGNSSPNPPVTLTATGSLGSADLRTATVTYILSDGSTGSGTTNLALTGEGAFIDGPYLQTLAQGGLTNIPTLGALGASGMYESTNTISSLTFTGQVDEKLGVNFANLSSNLNITDSLTRGSSLNLTAAGSLNAATGQIDLTPGSSTGPLTLNSASANLSASDLRQSTINYVVNDGQQNILKSNSVQGTIVGLGNAD